MKKNVVSKLATISLSLLFLSGCLVKPPPDDNLGPPIDIETINNAMIQAQAGVDPQKGFMLGDTGTVLTVDSTTSTSQISETDLYSITATTPTSFTVQEIANVAATPTAPATSTTTTTNYYRPGSGPSASPTPTPAPSPQATSASPQVKKPMGYFAKIVTGTFGYISRLLSRISIQPSTAVGEGMIPKAIVPGSVKFLKSLRPWTMNSELSVRGQTKIVSSLDLTPVALASPSPSPSDDPTITSDQYYRLVTAPDTVLTKNCTQIPNCTVNTTNIQFEEVIVTSAGQSIRLHWSYEFSTVVPGLFTMMARCWSQIITENGVQAPLTHCDSQLDDFRWGSPPN